jgi:RNA polymerase sigma factor (sigma-70 family)
MSPTIPVPPTAEVLALIERVARSVARSRRMPPADVDDFTQSVHARLAAGDYEILRRFEGRSSLKTYLTVVVARQLNDWQNHEYGKWRPCAAAVRTGPLGVALDRMINRDGTDVEEAVRTVSTRTGLAEADVRRVADNVPRRSRRRLVAIECADASTVDFDDPIVEEDRRRQAAITKSALAEALGTLPRDEVRLLLQRFVGGQTVAALAARSGQNAARLYARFERMRRDLRQHLLARGLTRAGAA